MPTQSQQPARAKAEQAITSQPGIADVQDNQETELSTTELRHARLEPHSLQPGQILQLQRTVGNRAVTQMLKSASVQRVIIETGGDTPDFTARPSEPYRETPLAKTIFAGKDVPQTRHHIIPWNTLSAFVRAATDSGHVTAVNGVLEPAVKTMMDNSPRYEPGKRGEVPIGEEGGVRKQGDITQEDLTAELGKDASKGDTANSAALNAIATAYCWMPGNLFLGPLNTIRVDDPDEDFESGAEEQVGGTFDKFKKAFGLIKAYVEVAKGERELAKATEIMSLLKPAAQQSTPFPFLEDKWIQFQDAKGQNRYYLKKNADLPKVKSALSEAEAAQAKKSAPKAPAKPKPALSAEKLAEIEKRKAEAAAKKKGLVEVS